MNLIELIKKLPYEIVEIIRRYTYLHQPYLVLNDIKNYYQTRKIASQLYYDAYKDNFDNCPNDDILWFSNDILIYMNKRQPIMFGYVAKYYDIMLRSYNINSIPKVIKYTDYLEKHNPQKEINVYWGLLYPNERIEMLSMFYSPQQIENVSKRFNF